jgi:hypothetical protein
MGRLGIAILCVSGWRWDLDFVCVEMEMGGRSVGLRAGWNGVEMEVLGEPQEVFIGGTRKA